MALAKFADGRAKVMLKRILAVILGLHCTPHEKTAG
jgi:hypothetical protein